MKLPDKIVSLEELEAAALNKRAVVDVDPRERWTRPIPAAIIIRMPAINVLFKLRRGLWLYKKNVKWKPFQKKEKT
jgi:hypothetical protein